MTAAGAVAVSGDRGADRVAVRDSAAASITVRGGGGADRLAAARTTATGALELRGGRGLDELFAADLTGFDYLLAPARTPAVLGTGAHAGGPDPLRG